MKHIHLAALLSAAALPLAATAQAAPPAPAAATTPAAPTLEPGTTVYDSQGIEIGKVESISGDSVVLAIGENRATLSKSAFGSGAKGASLNTTKAQIEVAVADAAAKSRAALDTALAVGANVQSKDGVAVGTVKSVAGDQIVLDRPAGAVTLTRQMFAAGPAGLTLSLSAAELDAAAKAATARSGAPAPAG